MAIHCEVTQAEMDTGIIGLGGGNSEFPSPKETKEPYTGSSLKHEAVRMRRRG